MNPELGDPFRSPPPTKGPRSLGSGAASPEDRRTLLPARESMPRAASCPAWALLSSPCLSPWAAHQMSSTGRVPSGVTSGTLQGKAIWEKIFKKQVVFFKKAQLIPTGSWVT